MELQEPIRIFSDIHVGHPASLARSPEDLTPLIAGAGTAVFNGDTVETLFRQDRPQAERILEALRAFCVGCGATPVFLNGNHDPQVSRIDHLDLADGAVLVTHGDILFEDISPWSPEAAIMGAAHRRELAEMDDAARGNLEKRLQAVKRAALSLEDLESSVPRGPFGGVHTWVRAVWPPWRSLRIIDVWRNTPDRAEALAREFRPRARFIVLGHTHHGGIWRRGPRVVINTGSFLPLVARTLVELDGRRLSVRKIARRGGRFEIGSAEAVFDAVRPRTDEAA